MNNVIPILENIKTLIATPETWTQGAAAREPTGEECDPLSDYACQWCLTGAIEKVAGEDKYEIMGHIANVSDRVMRAWGDWQAPLSQVIPYVNDRHGFEMVHRILDITIELEKNREK